MPPDPPSGASTKLSALALAASAVGLLAEIVKNLSSISDQLDKHFLITLAALWAGTILFTFTTPMGTPRQTRLRRSLIVGAATLLVALPLGWRGWQYYDHNYRHTRPAASPKVKLLSLLRIPTVFAATQPLKLNFFLNEDLCSFHQMHDHKFGDGPDVLTYAADPQVQSAFHAGSCIGVEGDRPAEAAVPVLREFWIRQKRPDLAAFLTSPDSLGHLIRDRGDIFDQIIPTSAQFQSMTTADYQVLEAWIHDCVGLYLPVFTFAFTNDGDQDVTLTRIIYHVHEIGIVKGRVAGPLVPLKTYDFTLEWKPGDQVQNIAFAVPAHQQAAFDVRLAPASSQPGITWWMNIEIIGSGNYSVKTLDFQLIMNKGH